VLRGLRLSNAAIAAFELREHRQLLDQDLGRRADRLFGRDRAVGVDLHHQLVEVGALLDAGALDRVADAATGENDASSTMRPIDLVGSSP
jgi:hypothetical protein